MYKKENQNITLINNAGYLQYYRKKKRSTYNFSNQVENNENVVLCNIAII